MEQLMALKKVEISLNVKSRGLNQGSSNNDTTKEKAMNTYQTKHPFWKGRNAAASVHLVLVAQMDL